MIECFYRASWVFLSAHYHACGICLPEGRHSNGVKETANAARELSIRCSFMPQRRMDGRYVQATLRELAQINPRFLFIDFIFVAF
jgi:hypothetical protein